VERLSQTDRLSIKEIADLVGDRRNRVKSVFDQYRVLFRTVNNPQGTQRRLYDSFCVKAYIIHREITSSLNYKSYRADEMLRLLDINLLWEHYKAGLQQLSAYLITTQQQQMGVT